MIERDNGVLKLQEFFQTYAIRILKEEDVDDVVSLCEGNPLYYQHCPPFVTRESIQRDMHALPSGIGMGNKYYLGCFLDTKLTAVVDLITHYPHTDCAYIGFFMVDASLQGKGVGSTIVRQLYEALRANGYREIQLAWIQGNAQAEHFWKKNGWIPFAERENQMQQVVVAARRTC